MCFPSRAPKQYGMFNRASNCRVISSQPPCVVGQLTISTLNSATMAVATSITNVWTVSLPTLKLLPSSVYEAPVARYLRKTLDHAEWCSWTWCPAFGVVESTARAPHQTFLETARCSSWTWLVMDTEFLDEGFVLASLNQGFRIKHNFNPPLVSPFFLHL